MIIEAELLEPTSAWRDDLGPSVPPHLLMLHGHHLVSLPEPELFIKVWILGS